MKKKKYINKQTRLGFYCKTTCLKSFDWVFINVQFFGKTFPVQHTKRKSLGKMQRHIKHFFFQIANEIFICGIVRAN
jgi:hypothetical protein